MVGIQFEYILFVQIIRMTRIKSEWTKSEWPIPIYKEIYIQWG